MENSIFENMRSKAILKQDIFEKSSQAFSLLRDILKKMVWEYEEKFSGQQEVEFVLDDHDDYKLELTFGGDVLVFMLHTNIFEFPRMHEVMKTSYIADDPRRSYCGVINIYNFLADSFRFNRLNDLGYMIGRVFVNIDQHFFIEGKREIGQLYNNFSTSVINEETMTGIVKSAIKYTSNFDLLTPPYDEVKLVRVEDLLATSNIKLVTGKRLGFRFQGDHIEIQEQKLNKI